MIVVTAISGAQNEDALCYLVEFDNEVKILLDCGWNDQFNVEDLKHLRRVAKQVDCLLLSHPDLPHLGAFPYACTNFSLNCPVYATVPVVHMGRMCLYDIYLSKTNSMEFDVFGLENVDVAFEKITPLKYSQPMALGGKCKGITITAYAAGHTIGGTIWRIKKDTEDVVYAVDYNHKKERHLDGTVMHVNGEVLDALSRPSLMITDAYNSLIIHPPRKQRESDLFEAIHSTLASSGSVLIPTDSSARVLELAYLLDQRFQNVNYPLILLTHMSYRTMQYAKSMLEWMSDAINRQFDSTRENPFEFRSLRLCHRLKDLNQYPGPKVVLASNLSLETGYAKDLLLEWGTSKLNNIDIDDVNEGQKDETKNGQLGGPKDDHQTGQMLTTGQTILLDYREKIQIYKRVPLEGSELVEYNQELQTRQQREAAQAALIARSKSIIEESDDDDASSDTSDDDEGMEELLYNQFDLYVRDATKSGGFFKQTQSYRMFPYVEKRKRFDDYGEILAPEMFEGRGRRNGSGGLGVEIEGRDGKGEQEKEDPTMVQDFDVPTKYVNYEEEIHFRCQLRFVDLEGLNDGRALKTIVPQVQPRKLIIIHASPEATSDFAQNCLVIESTTRDIYTPAVGEVLNVSAAINFYQVKLTDALVSSLKFSRFGFITYQKLDEYDLAYITGMIHLPPDSSVPVLDLVSADESTGGHLPVFIGEIKLTELKRVLQAEGIIAEFKGEGVLVCNEKVAVRKSTNGQLVIEGSLSEDYYKIRDVIYGQHAIL
ncbi:8313_t:CDS:10 [Paraglomus occultum]|uniref:Cleavage and polyadenylation specificity factor subunit 2 n=1 Tax=Paraglomus occultum TaxID=144539 RepID=A0A9N8Z2P2_9GLOM|nr:8313_t:CDS:10 [Paraglomus occultum]